MDAPTDEHPLGVESVQDAFGWPDAFLGRLAAKYGHRFLESRLRRWRWTFSSCFSGVGAAESALVSVSSIELVVEVEAVMSLQGAAMNYLSVRRRKAQQERPASVLFESTCELDASCQQVLRDTFENHCNFPDVTALDKRASSLWCSTHGRRCKVQKHNLKNRFLAQLGLKPTNELTMNPYPQITRGQGELQWSGSQSLARAIVCLRTGLHLL